MLCAVCIVLAPLSGFRLGALPLCETEYDQVWFISPRALLYFSTISIKPYLSSLLNNKIK